jgi:hypothetical protein
MWHSSCCDVARRYGTVPIMTLCDTVSCVTQPVVWHSTCCDAVRHTAVLGVTQPLVWHDVTQSLVWRHVKQLMETQSVVWHFCSDGVTTGTWSSTWCICKVYVNSNTISVHFTNSFCQEKCPLNRTMMQYDKKKIDRSFCHFDKRLEVHNYRPI